MSEPYWAALGGGSVDYKGAWAAGTAYAPGDVVRHGGVDYLAVNPSTGVDPGAAAAGSLAPLVTALPGSPMDGQEVILTDSLTAGTFYWRLRYVAARATNKWAFIGGAPLAAEVATSQNTTSTTYVALATAGPSLTLPIAGDYDIQVGVTLDSADGSFASYDIGGTAAVDADATRGRAFTAGHLESFMRAQRKALGAVTLTAKYRTTAGGNQAFSNRWMRATPVAVGG